jgi:fructose/tagatose bisphosphate aldolase
VSNEDTLILSALPAEPKASKRAAQISLIALVASFWNLRGDMGQTYGVPVSEIQEGIKNGVRKVNIDTDLRMASTIKPF